MRRSNDILTLIRRIRIVPDAAALKQELLALSDRTPESGPVRVGFVNAHALNLCYSDPDFLRDLLACEVLYRDGIGMKILCRMLGLQAGLNMNGTDFIPRLLKGHAGREAALLGTEQPYLGRASQALAQMGVATATMLDGFRPEDAYVREVAATAPAVAVLAMGMPKQERVAAMLARNCPYPCLIVCGGAILDFLGGKVTRAPELFRRFGMEWLYRLWQEPRRLFRRYVIGNALFLLRGMRLALRAA